MGGWWSGRGQSAVANGTTSLCPKSLENQTAVVMDEHGTPRIRKPTIRLYEEMLKYGNGGLGDIHTHLHTQSCFLANIHEHKTAQRNTHSKTSQKAEAEIYVKRGPVVRWINWLAGKVGGSCSISGQDKPSNLSNRLADLCW